MYSLDSIDADYTDYVTSVTINSSTGLVTIISAEGETPVGSFKLVVKITTNCSDCVVGYFEATITKTNP